MREIKFGTDGWRGLIADDFTFDNVRVVIQAVSDYLRKKKKGICKVVVGYDTRFLSSKFAQATAEVLAANNIKVVLSNGAVPTPVLSFAIKKRRLDGGIMVTASHNPAEFNGIKFKTSFAGSADSSVTNNIEKLLFKNKVKTKLLKLAEKEKLVKVDDLSNDYIRCVRAYVDIKLLKKTKLNILVDSMYGAGIGYLKRILKDTPMKIHEIRNYPNPTFGGIKPEPIESNLKEAISIMKKGKFDAGFANDGDADRIGAFGPKGVFINSHQILSLLLLHMVEGRKSRGAVAKTISGTRLIDSIAKKYNLKVYETPVGFKHICKLMLEDDILVGGEESGGFGFRGHTLERDGILADLLLLEMIAKRRESIAKIIKDMEERFGKFRYKREDIECENFAKIKAKFNKLAKSSPCKLLNKKIVEVKTFDGLKFILDDNSWLLFRLSGTEPILRIYAEANTKNQAEKLTQAGKKIIGAWN